MKILLFIIHSSLFITNCFPQWSVVSNQGNEAVSFSSINTGYSTANGITKKTTNGTGKISFDGSSLASGIYYYYIQMDNVILETKKMVLVK